MPTSTYAAKKKVSRIAATLIQGSEDPRIRMLVPETVKKSVKEAPLTSIVMTNLGRLYNGKPTFVTLSLYNVANDGTRAWWRNLSLKVNKKNRSKRFNLRLTPFFQETQVYEAVLINDVGREINTYRFAFLMEDFEAPETAEDESLDIDPEVSEVFRTFLQNLSIRKNMATVTRAPSGRFYLSIRERQRARAPQDFVKTDDFDVGVPPDEPVDDPDDPDDGGGGIALPGIAGQDGLSLNPRGDFNVTFTYEPNDVVFNPIDNSTFVALADVPAGLPAPISVCNDIPPPSPDCDGNENQRNFWMLILSGPAVVEAIPPGPPGPPGPPAPPPPPPPPPPGPSSQTVLLPANATPQPANNVDLTDIPGGQATRFTALSSAVNGTLIVEVTLNASLDATQFSILGVITPIAVPPVSAATAVSIPGQDWSFFIDKPNNQVVFINVDPLGIPGFPSFSVKFIFYDAFA